jgi:hypothetical protein
VKSADQLDEEVGHSISAALLSEGEFVNKWIAAAEVIDEHGQLWVRTFWPRGATPWDNEGLLSAARRQVDDHGWDEISE